MKTTLVKIMSVAVAAAAFYSVSVIAIQAQQIQGKAITIKRDAKSKSIRQVFSEAEVDYGKYQTAFWNWSGNNANVPTNCVLEVDTITLNYFPAGGGSVGRADLVGRDSGGNAIWRLQVVYAEPQKTTHLTFPKGLRLEAGGHVEVGFVNDGPGTIFASFNGRLIQD